METDEKCPGGKAGDRVVAPTNGRHAFGSPITKSTGERVLVCSFCGQHRPPPAQEAKREPQVGASGMKPLVKLQGYEPRAPDLRRNTLTLREKQTQLATQRSRLLTRDEAVKLGFPQHEIDTAWPLAQAPATPLPSKP